MKESEKENMGTTIMPAPDNGQSSVIDLTDQLKPVGSTSPKQQPPFKPLIGAVVLVATIGFVTIAVTDPQYRDDFVTFATTLISGYVILKGV
jgi:hypothetical protein